MDILERIESKLDKTVSASTPIDAEMGGVKLDNMIQMMELAKATSLSGPAVPPVFRGNPGLCLAIWIKATRFGFDPFALAEHAFVTVRNEKDEDTGKWEKVETLAYDSTVIRAIINSHAPIKGRIEYAFEGEGDNLVCTASATTLDGQVITHRSKTLATRKASLRRNDKGKIKGSPLWDEKPDVQLAYDTGRDLCRIHFPEIMLGWHDKDDFDEAEQKARVEKAKDITPAKPALSDRLKGNKGRGFDAAHVERETKSNSKPQTSADLAPRADGAEVSSQPPADDASAQPNTVEKTETVTETVTGAVTEAVTEPAEESTTVSVPDAMEMGRAMKARGEALLVPAGLSKAAIDAMTAGYEEAT